jgi:hypothetical protein
MGSAAAFASAIYAAVHTSKGLRTLFVLIGTLALVYGVSYVWLYLHLEAAEKWSEIMRPIGLASWLMAWTLEPIVMVRWIRRHGREIECRVDETIKQVQEDSGVEF